MMSYEEWLRSILAVAREAGSREFQEEAWLSGRPSTSSPSEIYNELFDDYSFDLFFETYSKSFTLEQMAAWSKFKDELESYLPKLRSSVNEREVFEDPAWQHVRESAAKFVAAFEQERSEAPLAVQQ